MSQGLETMFGRWGTPAHPVEISAAAREFLAARIGSPAPRPAVPVQQVSVPDAALPDEVRAALQEAVGREHVDTGPAARLRHAAGSSLTDYVHLREGRIGQAPDAVLHPSTHEEVLAVLQACARHDTAVVPFGGGTSVVGGVTPESGGHRAVVAVALDRMAEVVAVDEVSLTATVQPGITGPTLERLLESRGLMWGHLPQSWQRATIGGYIATRSAGQASSGYGRSDESVESVVVATPQGTVRLGRAPASAAGPDLRQVFIGSEGVLGIITEVTLRVRRQPRVRRYEGVMFPDFHSGAAAFRALAQADLGATVMRLSDESETEVTMAMSGPRGRTEQVLRRYLQLRGIRGGGCLAILGWEGVSPKATHARREAAWVALRRYGAVALGEGVGESWRKHRFEGPHLRDTLLDEGAIVETLETACDWSRLHEVHRSVGSALRTALAGEGYEPIVFCHVSHIYGAGASLYFTALAPAQEDRAAQWAAAKTAASGAIAAHGATITHHHAVGMDHRPWMADEVGGLGIEVLRGIKATLDPAGIMNPGKLIP